jgi:hypothetical protein
VIVMTTSQRPGQAETGSRVRHTLDGSLGALRHLNDEQIIFWECFWRSARAPQPGPQVSPRAAGGEARPGSDAPVPVGAGRGDAAA